MSDLPATKHVAYAFVSALVYGLYLSTVLHCLRWLIFADEGWKLRRRICWMTVTITILICVLSTMSRALDLRSSMITMENEDKPSRDALESTTALFWMDVLSVSLFL